jgi:hypothetical protein
MAALEDTGEQECYWSLVFEIGEVEPGSWCMHEGLAAELHLDTTLILVRPTEEEIARAQNGGTHRIEELVARQRIASAARKVRYA